jgi:flagellar capping protein FliD
MALDRWTMAAIAQDEASKTIQQLKIDEKIKAQIEAELNIRIKQEIDSQFADMREAVKIMNEQILILKDAVENISKKCNK